MDSVDKIIEGLIIFMIISSAIKCALSFIVFGFDIGWDFKGYVNCVSASGSLLECYLIASGE